MRFNKLFLPISLLAIGVLWGACVDVPDGPATNTNPDFHSQVRFFHAMPAGAAGNVIVDGSSLGNIGFLTATPYNDVLAGSRSVAFGTASAETLSIGSEEQSTLFIYSSGGNLTYLNAVEGHMNKNNGKVGVAKVKFLNLADGSASNVTFHLDDVSDPDAEVASSGFGAGTNYTEIDAGTSSVLVAQSIGSYPATVNGASEVPPVTTSSIASATVTQNFEGIHYSIDVASDNSQGFYTAAHFHNAPAGANGSVVHPIDISEQAMTFPFATLRGANEVPLAVATAATGTATFTLFRDHLVYSIEVSKDTLDSVFVAAHFHNAAAGANGPIVKTIYVGTFGDTVFDGEWTSTDTEPLTPALVNEIIAGNVYVNFHTVLNPGGAIRAQLIVDSVSSNVFAGTWDDATLTPALREEFNLDRMYINFHTVANPGGQIRGQALQSAKYGLTSLPAAAYDDSKMYTVVATGAGPSFQLTVLPDRQVAEPPTGKPQVKTTKATR